LLRQLAAFAVVWERELGIDVHAIASATWSQVSGNFEWLAATFHSYFVDCKKDGGQNMVLRRRLL
jgi:hypothetical protein